LENCKSRKKIFMKAVLLLIIYFCKIREKPAVLAQSVLI
jgi:hypothetical protein